MGGLRLWTRTRHPICLAIFKGVEGAEWENMYYKYEELHKELNLKELGVNKKAKALWFMRDTTASG